MDEVLLQGLHADRPSNLVVDSLMASYPRADRYQVELALAFHDLMTKHFGTESYDPEEALKLKFKQPDTDELFQQLQLEQPSQDVDAGELGAADNRVTECETIEGDDQLVGVPGGGDSEGHDDVEQH